MKKGFVEAAQLSFVPPPVRSYLKGEDRWAPFLEVHESLRPRIEAAIKRKSFTEAQRAQLFNILSHQKKDNPATLALAERLRHPHCWAIVCGHQPLFLGGPLFFWYKIAFTIALVQKCRQWFPQYDFVPLFWLASEDHDLQELFQVRLPDGNLHSLPILKDYKGPAGRVPLKEFLSYLRASPALFQALGLQPWFPIFLHHYTGETTLAKATLRILDELFLPYGLLTLDSDHPELKQALLPILTLELKQGIVSKGLSESQAFFAQHHMRIQLRSRDPAIFYITETERLPLRRNGQGQFLAGNFKLNIEALLSQPWNLSPNAALRPLCQEYLLPTAAFIAGPSEFHYWLQLPPVFRQACISMPALVLRPLAAWLPKRLLSYPKLKGLYPTELLAQQNLSLRQLARLQKTWTARQQKEVQALRRHLEKLAEYTTLADPALQLSAQATMVHFEKMINRLQQLTQRAWLRRHQNLTQRLRQAHSHVWPHGELQERSLSIWNMAFLQDAHLLAHLFEDFDGEGLYFFEEPV
ncbi:MAG: bacillithiol biosynthesis cysteine-adding enzyme BshC [Flavobacteriales bacterium]|nr:bacillithiol biosynthesis cysteine-adding enzyme BshC [Flavobacteriales bacterium]MCX7768984.1 bacillithiol biosynthesis cysteine-adding enzyme BshC [Flavobacteriales bacterium]MDW8410269.1 bacillithiol biosynthesis BshC [Flavobacteriales bacterium]